MSQPSMPAPPEPQPSWAPAWPMPGGSVPPGGPAAGPQAVPPARPDRGLLVGVAAAGALVGVVASGLLVTALFTLAADGIGETMADHVGAAVERGIVDGTVRAMEEGMDEALGAYPEEFGMPGGSIPSSEQFPPAPPEALGPDPVLDGYAQECFGGDLQACDDLMYESPPLSAYEEYATTCGGRVKAYTVVACTELD